MRKYILLGILVVFLGLIATIIALINANNKLQDGLSISDNNFKALLLENNNLNNQAIAYKFSIEQLKYLNDSIINDLNNTRKQLQIKDKEILQMQSFKTEIRTKDSILIKDTIFRDNFIKLDTVIADKWHTVAISLQPSKLIIDAKYRSELQVFAKSSKEIMGTPKKCFVGRLFQKKHKVIRVEVKDKNPNAIITEKKFIIIE